MRSICHSSLHGLASLGAAALALAGVLVLAPPAAAAVSCGFDAGASIVTVNLGSGDGAYIAREAGGDAIQVNGSDCEAATVFNTDVISVSGVSGSETVTISLAGGPLAPGATSEGSGASEIEVGLNLGTGSDTLLVEGGPGDDVLRAGDLGIDLNADGDVDVTAVAVEALEIYGLDANDTISAAGGSGTGSGTFAYPVRLYGDSGDDTITGSSGQDVIQGGSGADTLYGGPGADSLHGGSGNDSLFGGAGDDVFHEDTSNNGADVFNGGAGSDAVNYGGRSNPLSVTSSDGLANDGEAAEGDRVGADVEGVTGGSGDDTILGGPSADSLYGNAGNDTLSGAAGNDVLQGGDGNDTIFGGAGDDAVYEDALANGADTISGGAGSDTVGYWGRTNPVVVTLADGIANDGEAGEGDLLRVDVENVSSGSGADTLTGSSSANALSGGPGNDTLFAGAGDDTLAGGADNDALYAGPGDDSFDEGYGANGADTMNGGPGADTASYANRSNAVAVTLADATANDGEAGEGDLVRVDVENVIGGAGNDTLTGSSAANVLQGGGGSDTIFGGAGNDTLRGESGGDNLYGGDGDDSFDELDGYADYLNGGNGTDTAASYDAGLDTLVGIP